MEDKKYIFSVNFSDIFATDINWEILLSDLAIKKAISDEIISNTNNSSFANITTKKRSSSEISSNKISPNIISNSDETIIKKNKLEKINITKCESIPLFEYKYKKYISFYDIRCKLKNLNLDLDYIEILKEKEKYAKCRGKKYLIFLCKEIRKDLSDNDMKHFPPSRAGIFIPIDEIINKTGYFYEYLIKKLNFKFDKYASFFIEKAIPVYKSLKKSTRKVH